jgi:hypothetical protein
MAEEEPKWSFWNWLTWRFLHPTEAYKATVLTFMYGRNTAQKIMKEEEVDIPPTIGEMASTAAENIGKMVSSVFRPLFWVGGIVVFLFILWAFIGRKT